MGFRTRKRRKRTIKAWEMIRRRWNKELGRDREEDRTRRWGGKGGEREIDQGGGRDREERKVEDLQT